MGFTRLQFFTFFSFFNFLSFFLIFAAAVMKWSKDAAEEMIKQHAAEHLKHAQPEKEVGDTQTYSHSRSQNWSKRILSLFDHICTWS